MIERPTQCAEETSPSVAEARAWIEARLRSANRFDVEELHALRRLHLHAVAAALAHEGARHRRADGDLAARQVRLVIADDADPVAAVVLVQVGDDRAEADAAVHRLAFRAPHRGILQSARQPVAAPVDLAQALLVVDVVAVLAAVAVTGGPGDTGADPVALLRPPQQLRLRSQERREGQEWGRTCRVL